MTGSYRTVSFAAVTVVAGHPPLDLEIKETHSRWEIKRQMRQKKSLPKPKNYLPCTKCFGFFFSKISITTTRYEWYKSSSGQRKHVSEIFTISQCNVFTQFYNSGKRIVKTKEILVLRPYGDKVVCIYVLTSQEVASFNPFCSYYWLVICADQSGKLITQFENRQHQFLPIFYRCFVLLP